MDGEWSFIDNDSFGLDWFIDDPFEQHHDQSLTQIQNQLPPQLVLPQMTPQPQPQPQQQEPVQLSGHPESQRTIFTLEFQREISQWFMQNMNTPMQTKDTEDYFITKYGLTRRQVKTAFNNRRQRVIVPFRLKYRNEIEQTVISQLQSLGLQLVRVDE
jgi:hypothetical protein